MSYFIKRSKRERGIYLQIYRGYYDPKTKNAKNTTYKTLGYYDDFIAAGIEDPIAHFQKEVDELNKAEKEAKAKPEVEKIGDSSPLKEAGYFPLKNIIDKMDIKPTLDLFQKYTSNFKFNLYDMISALAFARVIAPGSKRATYLDVLPSFFSEYSFSYDQILEGCEFVGSQYEKIIELMTYAIQKEYGIDTSKTFFDATNFYFEIDKEDELRRKGPSKELRHDPIVGMGLMLDAHMIPIGMKVYPGNQSEKPVLRDVIQKLKDQNHIVGRTVHVADKGLNCAENILKSLKTNDGYIFSKSIKTLPETEKVWVYMNEGWKDVFDINGVLRYRYKECVDIFPYTYTDENGQKQSYMVKEKRVVTFNPSLQRKQRAEIDKEVNKALMLSANAAKKKEFGHSACYVSFLNKEGKVQTELNLDKINADYDACGFNMIVSSELTMSAEEIYATYHELWRIEETFRTLKSQLNARPVFLQKTDSIIGHFTINYIAIVLLRVLQFYELKGTYSTEELMRFMRNFKLVKTGSHRYTNTMKHSELIKNLAHDLRLPLDNMFFSKKEINQLRLDIKQRK